MKKVILAILDGWGIGKVEKSDAIHAANTPNVDHYLKNYPNASLVTHGTKVGLPEGQMGNSEVGHLNIGAGRVVYQDLARINKAIAENVLDNFDAIQDSINYVKKNNKRLHLIGLLSDGGVHSHIDHLLALIKIFADHQIHSNLHLFLDGRDTDPKSGIHFVKKVTEYIKNKTCTLSSIIGRYYAMDRDLRWERTKKSYDLMVKGEGEVVDSFIDTIEIQYSEGVTDEFMPPLLSEESHLIQNGDAIIFFNFRSDRPRQITIALSQSEAKNHNIEPLDLHFTTMTRYSNEYKGINVVFDKKEIKLSLGEVLSKNSKTQLRIAETEKYPHVTFFLSGGREVEWPGEKRILIPSPKVSTYDLSPEMSAHDVTAALINAIESESPDFVCVNYANADMVGHTGDFQAAVIAIETVDHCLNQLVESALLQNYDVLVIADHGNSDYMINNNGTPNTAHTTNLVPIIHISKDKLYSSIDSGKLADVAPTILKLMEIEQPEDMTGVPLLK